MNTSARHRQLFILAGLLLLAYGLRIFRLDHQSIWWDEGISLHLGTSSLSEIVRDRQDNIHPPLYFFMLKGWLSLVGVSSFTGRYLSVLASLGQVAIVYRAVHHWAGRASGHGRARPWLAATLVLISPLSVIYGQEIRVYAFLPLAYIGMLVLAEKSLSNTRLNARPLLALAFVEWIGLHLHYIAIFGVAYISLWGLVVLTQRRDLARLRRWIVVQGLVAVASLPWLVGILRNWSAVNAEANAGTFTTAPVPLTYLFAQVWAFHLTGLAGALASPFVQAGALVTAIAGVMLIVSRQVTGRQEVTALADKSITLRLLLHWLLPLASGLAVWSVRSFSHPRYITMFALMVIPVAVFLLLPARRWAPRLAAVALSVGMVALSFWGLRQYFFEPGAAKPDMRGVARYLETVSAAGDLILIPDTDWSLPFEYDGPAHVLMPHIDESPHAADSHLARGLDCLDGPPCAETGRVFVVDYPRGGRDWQDRLPFELARRGYWRAETVFEDVVVREYRLKERSGTLPECGSAGLWQPGARFGSLQIESVWGNTAAASDTALAVAVCWRAFGPLPDNYTASLLLRDPVTGERVSQADARLLDASGAPTTFWTEDQRVITYHVLPLPPGTPPVETELVLSVYSTADSVITPIEAIDSENRAMGELIQIGSVNLGPPVGLTSSPYEVSLPPQWDEAVDVVDGLQLAGARFSSGPYRPGQNIRVGLHWRSTTTGMPDYRPVMMLEQVGAELAETSGRPVNGRYPTDRWRAGETIFEYRDIRIPAGVEGQAELIIMVDESRVPLGQITIEGADVLYERPRMAMALEARFGDSIALIGLDPPPETIRQGADIPLVLYWESLSGDIGRGYTVFTHLLAPDGRLVAQHDSPPVNGQRPTEEWLPGEFVIDPHALVWRDKTYTGPARLVVGLYDPLTGERLVATDGMDSMSLPLSITVEPSE